MDCGSGSDTKGFSDIEAISELFSSVISAVGVPPHLVTLLSSSKQCEVQQQWAYAKRPGNFHSWV